jgi:hypothetical protein
MEYYFLKMDASLLALLDDLHKNNKMISRLLHRDNSKLFLMFIVYKMIYFIFFRHNTLITNSYNFIKLRFKIILY